jgi:hypothetical protein
MPNLVGTWKLVDVRAFDDVGREQAPPLGQHAMGVMIFEAERMLGTVCDGTMQLPPDVPSRAFGAYCGTLLVAGFQPGRIHR